VLHFLVGVLAPGWLLLFLSLQALNLCRGAGSHLLLLFCIGQQQLRSHFPQLQLLWAMENAMDDVLQTRCRTLEVYMSPGHLERLAWCCRGDGGRANVYQGCSVTVSSRC
jgi:hypothetical protein